MTNLETKKIHHWVSHACQKTGGGVGGHSFSKHPNYTAWRKGLQAMAPEGFKPRFLTGFSPEYCEELVGAGVDPKRIMGLFSLLFH